MERFRVGYEIYVDGKVESVARFCWKEKGNLYQLKKMSV